MKQRLWIRPEAERDLTEAYEWYAESSPGAGKLLVEEFERVLDRILTHPLAFESVSEWARRALLPRVPYGLFFAVEEERIVVLALFHLAQDPGHLESLLQERRGQ